MPVMKRANNGEPLAARTVPPGGLRVGPAADDHHMMMMIMITKVCTEPGPSRPPARARCGGRSGGPELPRPSHESNLLEARRPGGLATDL
jgi:hypothetical protein